MKIGDCISIWLSGDNIPQNLGIIRNLIGVDTFEVEYFKYTRNERVSPYSRLPREVQLSGQISNVQQTADCTFKPILVIFSSIVIDGFLQNLGGDFVS